MAENEHQDPAEANRLDTAVETESQPEPEPVEVTPEEPTAQVNVEVTPNS